jgi:DNA topoisomerase-1
LRPASAMAELWILRRGTSARGFRYAHRNGKAIGDSRTLARIDKLRIPPAWRDVHIAADSHREIQAWGYDARGRKQYKYHDRAVESRELRKYHRVRELAKALPRIRRVLRLQSHRRDLTCATTAAIALRLVSESLFRPGSEKYMRENRSYGLTTLRKRHVRLERDRAVFTYVGKSSKKLRQVVMNPELVRLIGRLRRTPGERLFRYRDATSWSDLSATTLIGYLRDHLGPFAVKDFRTWGGTLRTATVLAELGSPQSPTEARRNIALAMRVVAAELGNTPAICRSSYVHPMILARYIDDGETIPLRASRRVSSADSFAHSPEERELIAFLDKHFPERRRKSRAIVARAA